MYGVHEGRPSTSVICAFVQGIHEYVDAAEAPGLYAKKSLDVNLCWSFSDPNACIIEIVQVGTDLFVLTGELCANACKKIQNGMCFTLLVIAIDASNAHSLIIHVSRANR